ncbi:hypothetical protein [Zavarzinia aquatilis]|uniref:Uncharacterized protein n=1 Tax=Zavarzinia aquatilis TaxID=2211142 RepID=A0A317E291_9PROT|nr:hypothetical protein [Zavarzinia aquatilis]PWR21207.1 hypothetical protein DKG74_14470 [Zavarzinia aquatilis]
MEIATHFPAFLFLAEGSKQAMQLNAAYREKTASGNMECNQRWEKRHTFAALDGKGAVTCGYADLRQKDASVLIGIASPYCPPQVHDWGGQARVLAADGGPLGTVQAALNPNRSGLLRAQVATDVAKIDITYLGPDDLIGA